MELDKCLRRCAVISVMVDLIKICSLYLRNREAIFIPFLALCHFRWLNSRGCVTPQYPKIRHVLKDVLKHTNDDISTEVQALKGVLRVIFIKTVNVYSETVMTLKSVHINGNESEFNDRMFI